ncbi:acyltransferase [Leucobacter zeae]|nr:acyltransferase [Leucobacter zeae]
MTVTEAPRARTLQRRSARPASAFRGDIQGLRALAVGMVVVYHLWPTRLPGGFAGVDVFFVISGFLITGHLLRRVPERPRDLVEFWARRIRRLLPASLLVLLATIIGAFLLAPSSMWTTTAQQAVAAVFYVSNWQLATESVDYLAADTAASAVQHFWSLGVEEQFYLVWPVLFLLVGRLVARRGGNRAWFAVLVLTVVLASFCYGLWLTFAEPAAAYFVTPARIWELGVGGLVAIGAARGLHGRIPARGALAWLGLGLIVLSAFWLSPTMPFPGYAALLPVAGTALVLGCGSETRGSPARLLSSAPARFIGDHSYAIYLWHWPLIVLAPGISGTLGPLDRGLLLVATLALAWLTSTYVEPVFRSGAYWRPLSRTYVGALIAMLVVAGAGAGLWAHAEQVRGTAQARIAALAESGAPCVGAAALPTSAGGPGGCDITGDDLTLNPVAAQTDKSVAYDDRCWSSGDFAQRPTCTYGDGAIDVALVGNSHAGHWLGPLTDLAEARGWTITTFLIDRCNGTVTTPLAFDTEAKTAGCQEYAEYVRERTTGGEFDAVIVSQRQSVEVAGGTWETTERPMIDAQAEMLRAWDDAGLSVMVIRDTPYPGKQDVIVPDCVAAHLSDPTACDGTTEEWHWMDPLAEAADGFSASTAVLDPTEWICPEGTCRAVIGGMITYFDGSHLTDTYARTLAPSINRWLDEHPELRL